MTGDRDPPPDLKLRARPRPIRRLNKRALMIGAAVIGLLIAGATIVALNPPRLAAPDKRPELYVRLMSGPAVKLNPRNFRSCGRATALFALVYLEFELLCDEARDALHHPLTRAFAANVNVTVVRIANKAVSPALQLLVEFVEHEVT